jgi:hypothetical protein
MSSSSSSSALKVSTSNSPPVYTPSTSKFDLDDQSTSPVSMTEKTKALTTALCTMRYQFATYPNFNISSWQPKTLLFTLKQSPGTWWSKLQPKGGPDLIDGAIYGISQDSEDPAGAAAKLLLVIMMSSIHVDLSRAAIDMDLSERDQFYQRVFKDSTPESAEYNKTAFENSVREKLEFYRKVFKKAVHELFRFHGAPQQYLCWIQNIKAGNEGCLKGFVDEQGQAYFKVAPVSGLVWLSRREGMDLGHQVIGELPPLPLELL